MSIPEQEVHDRIVLLFLSSYPLWVVARALLSTGCQERCQGSFRSPPERDETSAMRDPSISKASKNKISAVCTAKRGTTQSLFNHQEKIFSSLEYVSLWHRRSRSEPFHSCLSRKKPLRSHSPVYVGLLSCKLRSSPLVPTTL